MFYTDDRRAVPTQATDGAGHVRVVDDQVVRKASRDEQAVIRAVGHVLDALLLAMLVLEISYCGTGVVGREGKETCTGPAGDHCMAVFLAGSTTCRVSLSGSPNEHRGKERLGSHAKHRCKRFCSRPLDAARLAARPNAPDLFVADQRLLKP